MASSLLVFIAMCHSRHCARFPRCFSVMAITKQAKNKMNLSLAVTLIFAISSCLNLASGHDSDDIRRLPSINNKVTAKNKCIRQLDDVTYQVDLDGVFRCIVDLIRTWNWLHVCAIKSAKEQDFDLDTLISALQRSRVKSDILSLNHEELARGVKNIWRDLVRRCNTLLVFGSNRAVAEITRKFELDGLMNSTQVWMLGLSDPFTSAGLIVGSAAAAPQFVAVSPVRDQVKRDNFANVAGACGRVQLFDLFNGTGSAVKAIQFGDWTPEFGLNIWDRLAEEPDAWRMQRRTVQGVTFQQPPFSILRTDANGRVSFSGYILDIVSYMSQHLNFQFEARVTQEAQLGSKMNNTYTGLVGALHRREADIALTIFSITKSRSDGMSFLFTISNGLMGLAFQTPGKYISSVAHVLAFSVHVWTLTAVATIALMAFLMVSHVAHPNFRLDAGQTKKYVELIKWIMSGDFLEANTLGTSPKVFLGTFLLLTLVLTACYNSVFMAFFTYSKSPITFSNVEDLVTSDSFKVTLVRQTGFHDTFSNAKTGLYKDLWKKIIKDNQPLATNTLQALQTLCSTPNLVLLCDANTPNVYVRDKAIRCHVSSIRTNHMKDFGHIGVRKDFPYSRVFFRETLRLKESGVLNRLQQKYFGIGPSHAKEDEKSDKISLDLIHFSIPFYVIVSGLICSPVALLVEMVFDTMRRRMK